MHLTLTRPKKTMTKAETLGLLEADGVEFATIEQPWNGNKNSISCVPAGDYTLVKHSGKRFKNTWALVSKKLKVYHLKSDRPKGKGRFACVFHAANWASQLLGCVALGEDHAVGYDRRSKKSMPMVTNSRKSILLLKSLMAPEDEHTLTIVESDDG